MVYHPNEFETTVALEARTNRSTVKYQALSRESGTRETTFHSLVVVFKEPIAIPAESKKHCQSEDLIGTGSSNLPITLVKMAYFGE